MSFRLRRGTDSERQSVVFAEGELVYTTDSKELYVGDGHTLGGIRITGSVTASPIALTRNLDLNSFDITGSGDIDINGMVTADAFFGDGSGLTNLPVLDVNNGATYQINIMGADSSIIVNSNTSQLNGDLVGNVIGNVEGDVKGSVFDNSNEILINNTLHEFYGNVVGKDGSPIVENKTKTFHGTLLGSVQGHDSTLIVDAGTGAVHTSTLYTHTIQPESATLNVLGTAKVSSELTVSCLNNRGILILQNQNLTADLSADNIFYGSLFFSRNDINGEKNVGVVGGLSDSLVILIDDGSGTYPESNTVLLKNNGHLGIGTYSPGAKLDVNGNILARGAITPGVYANATARDAAITVPAAGMMIFNTALQKFQGYVSDTGLAGGGGSNATPGWINLN